jgi:hypothetical protein
MEPPVHPLPPDELLDPVIVPLEDEVIVPLEDEVIVPLEDEVVPVALLPVLPPPVAVLLPVLPPAPVLVAPTLVCTVPLHAERRRARGRKESEVP